MDVTLRACPVCASTRIDPFFEVAGVPSNIGVLWPDKDSAMNCPKGDIRLGLCRDCGFVMNMAFDASRLEYSQAYDNSLHYSPFYQEYARTTAMGLIERYGLREKTVVEIGCGKGDFLLLLCELGSNKGIGFDPSFEPGRVSKDAARRITFIRDFYSERYADIAGDLVCCRYVFEHLSDPAGFLRTVRAALRDKRKAVVYFEVPNIRFIVEDMSVWDIIYEHCSYFGKESLARVFSESRFDVQRIEEVFNGQYLSMEAVTGNGMMQPGMESGSGRWARADPVAGFGSSARKKIVMWRQTLSSLRERGGRTILWGAGAKGVSFLNMLKVRDEIDFVVDINPHKEGKHIPGAGHKIVTPRSLLNAPPSTVIVTNRIYENEIRKQVGELGLSPSYLVL